MFSVLNVGMSDAKYFTRGKVEELRADLVDDKKDSKHSKKRSTLKRVVANMTMGNDMVALFPDVMNCMQIPDLEIKKMVYLYLINYAKQRPDIVLMAVNSFIKDAMDPNPLVRALAIRTMSYIDVDRVYESLTDPLRQALKDKDPYVRKTAALAVAKLYFNNRKLVIEEGLLNGLKGLMTDSNPTVVANALAALMEIYEKSDDVELKIDLNTASNLCAALNECSEWAQVSILEALLFVVPETSSEAENLVERIQPRLQHANSAVLLTTARVLFYLITYITDDEVINVIYRKMAPPLVTLLSGTPEIQYVALRNIFLIIQKRPDILRNDLKVFFCKYNDPIYVKLSKLEIMFRLVHDSNVDLMLAELKEYASEVDVDFVRKSVRSIGRTAIKIEPAADKCIEVLVELIQTKVNYVTQEAIVVIKDIFRKYPNRYESVIGTLCESLESLDEPEAKASMIWIIGQYADRIENSPDLLDGFVENFLEETTEVQLSLLTATVKLFIRRPNDGKELLPKILKWATEEVDDPDVRDRGFIYWRLLSTNPIAAKSIVLSDKPSISTEADNFDPILLEELLLQVSSLSSIYHKPPRTFLSNSKGRLRYATSATTKGMAKKEHTKVNTVTSFNAYSTDVNAMASTKPTATYNLLDLDLSEPVPSPSMPVYGAPPTASPATVLASQFDQLGLDRNTSAKDLMNIGLGVISTDLLCIRPKEVYLQASSSKGLELHGCLSRRNNQMGIEFTFFNRSLQPLSEFAVQLNKNSFALVPVGPIVVRSPLPANQSAEAVLRLTTSPLTHLSPCTPLNMVQVAIKNNMGLFFFQINIPLYILFKQDGPLPQADFLKFWRETPDSNQKSLVIDRLQIASIASLKTLLSTNGVFNVAERELEGKYMLYLSSVLETQATVVTELQTAASTPINAVSVLVKSPEHPNLLPLYLESIALILRQK